MHYLRDRPQGPNNVTRWMFYAKWWHQFRKGAAGHLARYVFTKKRADIKNGRRFHRIWTMLDAQRTKRFTSFLQRKKRWRHRPYAGKLRLAPARWI